MKPLIILSFFVIQCFGNELILSNQDKTTIFSKIQRVEIPSVILPFDLSKTAAHEESPSLFSAKGKTDASLETANKEKVDIDNTIPLLEITNNSKSVIMHGSETNNWGMIEITPTSSTALAKVSLVEDKKDEEYREPTAEEISSILQQVEEIYTKDMESHGEYFSIINAAKEMSATSLYQTTVKDIIAKFVILREDFFQKISVLCEKYPEVETAKKIKAEAASLSSKENTELLSNFITLIVGGKLSDNNLYSEREFYENTLVTVVKFIIVSDLCDNMKIAEEKLVVVFVDKFLGNITNICAHSNNEFLNRLSTAIKDEKSFEAFLEKKVFPETLSSIEKPSNAFENELTSIANSFDSNLEDLASTFFPSASSFSSSNSKQN
jgi:hypothetical protein